MEAKLIDYMGDDLTVVNAARVSFNKQSEWEIEPLVVKGEHHDVVLYNKVVKSLSDKDEKLINYLAKNGHWTPFSHAQITIHEKVPIFVARQRFKHMVGFTYNEVSRRYVDDEPEFFVPEEWRGKPVNAKQGSSDEIMNLQDYWGNGSYDPDGLAGNDSLLQYFRDTVAQAKRVYTNMIKVGVAPEQARMVLPQSLYTEYWVTGSLAAWARAYKLRIDPHAQKEIQDLAKQWDKIIEPLFPVSWKALTS